MENAEILTPIMPEAFNAILPVKSGSKKTRNSEVKGEVTSEVKGEVTSEVTLVVKSKKKK